MKTTSESDVSVSNTFEQTRTVTKAPFQCNWYPFALDSNNYGTHLYDNNEVLAIYDAAYMTTSQDREMIIEPNEGHYFLYSILLEKNAEVTLHYDIDGENGIQDDYHQDLNSDGDTEDTIDISLFGHCDMATAVVISENEPSGNFQAPNNQVFTPSLKKGLLVALYHDFTKSTFYGHDVSARDWHAMLEGTLFSSGLMFGADITNTGTGPDTVWNYPIYDMECVSYKEKSGQSDEHVVEIICDVKYWKHREGVGVSVNYQYNITYTANGELGDVYESSWITTEANRPDTVWMPNIPTEVSSFWDGELDYNIIRQIVPAP